MTAAVETIRGAGARILAGRSRLYAECRAFKLRFEGIPKFWGARQSRMKIEISQDVVWREFGGEVVMLDLASQHYFGLTGTGSEMWQLIAAHGSSDSVIDCMLAKYDVDPASLRADFEKLVNELAAKGMLRVSRAD